MTTSVAGIYGNFGQANYASAKLGLVGLAQTLAIEGASKNIHVNAIGPTAGSRLTETVLPKEIVEALKPEFITPLVVKLCHDSSDVTARLFELGGGWIYETRWEQAQGVFFTEDFTAEEVDRRWGEITSFTSARHGTRVADCRNGVRERRAVLTN